MSNKNEAAWQRLRETGVCDERNAAITLTATELPRGEYGMVTVGVRGNEFSVWDTDMRGRIGPKLYAFPMKDVADFSVNGLLGELLHGYTFRFTYQGKRYSFRNGYAQKCQLAIFREEAGKK